jgi:ATP-dependent DNA ligase
MDRSLRPRIAQRKCADIPNWGETRPQYRRNIREQPLLQRRAQLEALLERGASRVIRFSESFPDANALLAECARRGLEGIVSKRKHAPYRSGTRSGWIKVKTAEWKSANQYRAKLFEKQRR